MKGWDSIGTGRRKTAVARVFIKSGSGKIIINNKDIEDYFQRKILQFVVRQPLAVLDRLEEYDIKINVKGSGKTGQAGACRHGIARALDAISEDFRPIMKPHGFLTRDAREVERKKFGRHKARKKPQFSKR